MDLLKSYKLGNIRLSNRVVSTNTCIEDCTQGASLANKTQAGLIITEGIAPYTAENPSGASRLYSEAHIEKWEKVTNAVHNRNGKIFLDILHSVDKNQKQLILTQSKEDFNLLVDKYVVAAKNSIYAGFDGIEINCGEESFLSQFLDPSLNKRTDEYGGGSDKDRCKLVLDIVKACIEEVGSSRVGIRISRLGKKDATNIDKLTKTQEHLITQLNNLRTLFLLIDNATDTPLKLNAVLRNFFDNTIILTTSNKNSEFLAEIPDSNFNLIATK